MKVCVLGVFLGEVGDLRTFSESVPYTGKPKATYDRKTCILTSPESQDQCDIYASLGGTLAQSPGCHPPDSKAHLTVLLGYYDATLPRKMGSLQESHTREVLKFLLYNRHPSGLRVPAQTAFPAQHIPPVPLENSELALKTQSYYVFLRKTSLTEQNAPPPGLSLQHLRLRLGPV